ncbi:hypothetical protein HYP85_gp049 [Pseudomonas phage Zuri]|uniref:Uncharacterized protein n=1 Tax=Pseudomonas phage Zuri TaxID=2604899 RepID=A0A5C1K6W5_9CAUD|nr:hypothetical protein HYP85_gp049 [Pseudomonas phage Zuri]QEM41146.1 hypothetical protein Zuri_49 [Pseudomonas phage Zuri]
MAETTNTLEERNESQRKTILKQVARIQELEIWEKFARYLLNNCNGQTVTPENLEKWLEEAQQPRRK